MRFHEDAIGRQEVIAGYLLRHLTPADADEFEAHYLGCDECFQELRATELLSDALRRSKLYRRELEGVSVFAFHGSAELTSGSHDLEELTGNVLEQKDSRVVLDLSRISRIDSTGLGQLMHMHTHLLRSRGALRVLNPNSQVERLLKITRIDTVLVSYPDEQTAAHSFDGPVG
jgi:anti-sigma B factor antagonist